LKVNKETVSQIRRGILELSSAQRLKIMDRLWSIRVQDLLAKMAPESLANQLITLSHKGAGWLAFGNEPLCESAQEGGASFSDEDECSEDKMTNDIALIDLFKNYGCKGGPFATDKDMADVLGLKRNTISSIRKGARLGPLPRLRMLKAINPEIDIDQVLNGIESNQSLHDLIEKHITMMAFKINQHNAEKNSP
jgi:transcriptional regulator with XRE-family HTH domain